ncbi:hypothetical protein [Segatella copri]|uniref:Uncharacterized protein n=1 Tax=Segatella copri TaxID=165179 RepID=A0AAW5ICQ0_9BACT|nr:hypothetical protein [Segatella copri]UWI12601.1 MAG: hypothetical protein [Bacteriophage sp.]MCP9546958.1 hypothetical protein [Segatella copri]MCP9549400.1 hypothetical protein [Segatella copri]MCP9554897.1 hypothetical protein [Segatella copri]MCP9569782.1 hypothetical protein [Segatella copri]
MNNEIIRKLLLKNDWSRIIFRFSAASSYTLFSSDKFIMDSFCIYIYPDGSRMMNVLDIESLISMDIKKKELQDIVEED